MSKEKNITNSPDLIHKEISQLAEIFPQFVSEGKVDLDGLKAYLANEKIEGERYHLDRHGKSKAKLIAREPSKATLRPKKAKSKERDTTGNLLIEGDNLEVLKLLQNSYYEKIKCIYIDPPYNKDKDFVYRDTWKDPVENYLRITGQKDEQGEKNTDTETTGRKHSNWLNMIYPRLVLARKLLKDDGVIFVSIDDDEVANLRKVMDEIFGEENFVANFVWKNRNSLQHDEPLISQQTERIMVFCKDKNQWNKDRLQFNRVRKPYDATEYKNPDNDPRGPWLSSGKTRNDGRPSYTVISPTGKQFTKPWIPSQVEFKRWEEEDLIWWGKDGNSIPRKKAFLKDFQGNAISDYLADEYIDEIIVKNEKLKRTKIFEIGTTERGTKELKDLFDGNTYFDYPKPVSLIEYLIKIVTDKLDIILDFFAGSGTTGHAVMKLNAEDGGDRKYILVQLPEQIDEKAEAYKAGYRKISDITCARLDKSGEQIESGDRGFKYLSLSTSNFQELDPIQLKEGKISHEQLLDRIAMEYDSFGIKGDRTDEDLLFELLIRYGYPLTTEIVKDSEFTNRYKIGEKILVSLENQISSTDIQQFVKKYQGDKEIQFVCKDEAINDGDRLTLANQFPKFSTL